MPTAMEPHHNRQRLTNRGRAPNVQRQAVLAALEVASGVDRVVGIAGLPAGGPERVGHLGTVPRLNRHRRTPAQLTDRGLRKPHAAIDSDPGGFVRPHAFELTVPGLGHGAVTRLSRLLGHLAPAAPDPGHQTTDHAPLLDSHLF